MRMLEISNEADSIHTNWQPTYAFCRASEPATTISFILVVCYNNNNNNNDDNDNNKNPISKK